MHQNKFVFAICAACLLISLTVSASEQTVAGKIKTVDTDKNSITVDDVVLDVTRKTKITVDGKKATLKDVQSGQQANVTYDDSLEAAISIVVGKEAEKDEVATAKVTKSLQGEWKCVAGDENGKAQDKSTVKQENRRVTIKGNSLAMARTGSGGKFGTYVGKFEIDISNGHFDWVGKAPNGEYAEWLGIYELDDSTIKLCFVYQKDGKAKRPKDFKSLPSVEPGMHHVSYTFKRDTD